MNQKNFLYILLISFFIKLIISFQLPLFGDEAYYWFWGQHLQLSYFDHPGFIAWMTSLSQFVPFFESSIFKLKFLFVCLSTLTLAVWIIAFKEFQSELFKIKLKELRFNSDIDLSQKVPSISTFELSQKSLVLFSIFFCLNPLTGPGSFIVTPDALLLLFWGLSLYFFIKLLSSLKNKYALFLGVSLGLGFCSKYHMALFPITAFGFYTFLKKEHLKSYFIHILIIGVFGLLFSLPPIVWNYQNEFKSFLFQINHGLNSKKDYHFIWTLSYILGQIFIFNPYLIFSQFKPLNSLKVSGLIEWGFFLISSLKAKVEANWPVTSHSLFMSALNYDMISKSKLKLIFGFFAFLYSLVFVYFQIPLGKEKLNTLPSTYIVNQIKDDLKNYEPLYGPSYQLSSLLSISMNKEILKLKHLSRHDFYDDLQNDIPTSTRFYVLKYSSTNWPSEYEAWSKNKIKDWSRFSLELFEVVRE